MLEIITLGVIHKIFTEDCLVKLSASSQAFYINCLIYHFKELPAKTHNAIGFDIFNSDISNISKYSNQLKQLNESGLITLNHNVITFNNYWGSKIDRSKLEKSTAEEAVIGYKSYSVLQYQDDLYNSETIFRLSNTKHELTKQQTINLIKTFIEERIEAETTYQSYSNCFRDLMYYLKTNYRNEKSKSINYNGQSVFVGNKAQINELASLTKHFLEGDNM